MTNNNTKKIFDDVLKEILKYITLRPYNQNNKEDFEYLLNHPILLNSEPPDMNNWKNSATQQILSEIIEYEKSEYFLLCMESKLFNMKNFFTNNNNSFILKSIILKDQVKIFKHYIEIMNGSIDEVKFSYILEGRSLKILNYLLNNMGQDSFLEKFNDILLSNKLKNNSNQLLTYIPNKNKYLSEENKNKLLKQHIEFNELLFKLYGTQTIKSQILENSYYLMLEKTIGTEFLEEFSYDGTPSETAHLVQDNIKNYISYIKPFYKNNILSFNDKIFNGVPLHIGIIKNVVNAPKVKEKLIKAFEELEMEIALNPISIQTKLPKIKI